MSSMKSVKSESNFSDLSGDTASILSLEDDCSWSSRRVSFGVTQVREYELVIGDHPECKIGVPLSLGWGYHEQESIPMEKYENERVSKGKLRMSSIARKNILRNVFGFPEEEIRAAEKEVQRIVKQKENTYSEANVSTKTQSRLKKVGKKFRKFITAESFIRGLAAASQSTMTMAAVTAP